MRSCREAGEVSILRSDVLGLVLIRGRQCWLVIIQPSLPDPIEITANFGSSGKTPSCCKASRLTLSKQSMITDQQASFRYAGLVHQFRLMFSRAVVHGS